MSAQDDKFAAIYEEADKAGIRAGNGETPTPMIVGTPTTPFSNDIDPTKKVYVVNDGVCGFAWVNIKPATTAFAKWYKKAHNAHKAYYGGYDIWCWHFNQSMTRKEAWARAFAEVLRKHGIECSVGSRMD